MKRNISRITKGTSLFLFILSGFVALIYQVVWLKMLVLVFGNTIWAVSTILTAFMAGLALGSWFFGKIADQTSAPLRIYGIIEGLIGGIGLITIFLFKAMPSLYPPLYRLVGGDNFLMGLLKFSISFLILIIPTAMMGGTLPLLAKEFTRDVKNAGSDIGVLYTLNTMGAVLGTFCSGFWLIPSLGLKKTIWFAVLINLLILFSIHVMTRNQKVSLSLGKLREKTRISPEKQYILWVYALVGLTSLGYEVIWNRVMVLHTGTSVYAYASILVIYLLGITLGAAIMSYYTPRIHNPQRTFAILQLIFAVIIIIQIKQFGSLSAVLHSLREFLGPQSYAGHVGSLLLGTLQIIIAPTVIMGACFPLAVRLFLRQKENIGKETGILYAYNTSGTIIGSFAAGFILLPLMGIQNSLIFLALINLSLGVYLLLQQKRKTPVILMIGGITLVSFIILSIGLLQDKEIIRKAHIFRSSLGHKVELLNLSEDLYATVTVEKHTDVRGPWRSLSLNGVNVAGTSSELFSIQKLQGHLPLLLHPDPHSVLHIGFGSGGTAWAVSRYPVKEITIAEISKSVIKKSAEYFKDINHDVVKDPRVSVHFTDGRNYILGTRKKFDIILSDSIHPRFSGNGSLYTYEYYQMLKKRLKPGGLVSFWLPFYSLTLENFQMIVKSFHEVFPNTSVWYINNTINPYVIVIGRTGNNLFSVDEIGKKMKSPGIVADLQEIDIDTPFQILDYFLFSEDRIREFTGDVPLHTDNNMAVEYISGQVINRQESILTNFVHLLHFRTSILPLIKELTIPGERADYIQQKMKTFEQATRFNLMGQILINDGKHKEAISHFEMVRKLNPLDLEPVEYFGASYQKPFLKKAKLR